MDKQDGFSDIHFDPSGTRDQLFYFSLFVSYRFTSNKTQLTEFPEPKLDPYSIGSWL